MGHRLEFFLALCHSKSLPKKAVFGICIARLSKHEILLQTLRRDGCWRTLSGGQRGEWRHFARHDGLPLMLPKSAGAGPTFGACRSIQVTAKPPEMEGCAGRHDRSLIRRHCFVRGAMPDRDFAYGGAIPEEWRQRTPDQSSLIVRIKISLRLEDVDRLGAGVHASRAVNDVIMRGLRLRQFAGVDGSKVPIWCDAEEGRELLDYARAQCPECVDVLRSALSLDRPLRQ
jgi:hypothetical protein